MHPSSHQVFNDDSERDMWLRRDGVCEHVELADLMPFARWAAEHGAVYGFTAPAEGSLTPQGLLCPS